MPTINFGNDLGRRAVLSVPPLFLDVNTAVCIYLNSQTHELRHTSRVVCVTFGGCGHKYSLPTQAPPPPRDDRGPPRSACALTTITAAASRTKTQSYGYGYDLVLPHPGDVNLRELWLARTR